MAENKVQFNLKNVHYSVLTKTVGTGGTISYSYATPVAIPGGGVNLTLDPAGETTPFYADGVIFYNAISNSGYTSRRSSRCFMRSTATPTSSCTSCTIARPRGLASAAPPTPQARTR